MIHAPSACAAPNNRAVLLEGPRYFGFEKALNSGDDDALWATDTGDSTAGDTLGVASNSTELKAAGYTAPASRYKLSHDTLFSSMTTLLQPKPALFFTLLVPVVLLPQQSATNGDLLNIQITTKLLNRPKIRTSSRTFSSQPASKLDVLLLNGHTLGVDSSQISVFEQRDQVRLDRFLQSTNGRRLESQISLEILCNFPDQSLEGQFSDQKFRRLLESSDFSQGNSTWLVSVWLLDTTSGWSRLSCGLRGQLLSWCLTTSRLSCCLLGSCHLATILVSLPSS